MCRICRRARHRPHAVDGEAFALGCDVGSAGGVVLGEVEELGHAAIGALLTIFRM